MKTIIIIEFYSTTTCGTVLSNLPATIRVFLILSIVLEYFASVVIVDGHLQIHFYLPGLTNHDEYSVSLDYFVSTSLVVILTITSISLWVYTMKDSSNNTHVDYTELATDSYKRNSDKPRSSMAWFSLYHFFVSSYSLALCLSGEEDSIYERNYLRRKLVIK